MRGSLRFTKNVGIQRMQDFPFGSTRAEGLVRIHYLFAEYTSVAISHLQTLAMRLGWLCAQPAYIQNQDVTIPYNQTSPFVCCTSHRPICTKPATVRPPCVRHTPGRTSGNRPESQEASTLQCAMDQRPTPSHALRQGCTPFWRHVHAARIFKAGTAKRKSLRCGTVVQRYELDLREQ